MFQFAQSEVTFAGFILAREGNNSDSSIIDAISHLPTPSNHTDLHYFFEIINQITASTHTVSGLLIPLKFLLSTKNDLILAPKHDQAFNKANQLLTIASTPAF